MEKPLVFEVGFWEWRRKMAFFGDGVVGISRNFNTEIESEMEGVFLSSISLPWKSFFLNILPFFKGICKTYQGGIM